jgi:membrane protease YdiL (CAAX protease family)
MSAGIQSGSRPARQATAPNGDARSWGAWERLALAWISLALLSLVPVTMLLQGVFPVFTLVWLVVPFVVLLRTHDASHVGIRPLPWHSLVAVTAINCAGLLVLYALCEPWSHAYAALIHRALAEKPVDVTFGWLVRATGVTGWTAMLVMSGLVTIFAEEIFFRGWLLLSLRRRMSALSANVMQAVLFTIPQSLAAIVISGTQGLVYVVVYSWLAVGIVGGWAALRTRSIWPSLISATLCNFILTAWLR